MTRPTNVNISIFNIQAVDANSPLSPACLPPARYSAGAETLDHPLEVDEPCGNIINQNGVVLWYQCPVRDAQLLADERRADVGRFPEWQGPLALALTPPRASQRALDIFPMPLPAELRLSSAPPLVFCGGSIGLGNDHPLVIVACGDWCEHIRIEEALCNIDRFTAPCQERILACLPCQYDMVGAS
ncbi:hypothetical protein PO883_14920 [Massilia sp. DJPM01]|uniref:hypothetical protein n=1 Tax=Massilia sp. DJPM01 TaxID=3024404 RepID=UPI00259E8916|nr:hypothetical protein [Massilia sp. DJPM01]MDM5178488.1 hypothetical protein [Massilia sp. DJPM01]